MIRIKIYDVKVVNIILYSDNSLINRNYKKNISIDVEDDKNIYLNLAANKIN
jgi:hypothetical protein